MASGPAIASYEGVGHVGLVVWLTGLSGSGKSTVAYGLSALLQAEGHRCKVLDGDILRRGLCADLGFNASDRAENVRRTGELAKLFAESGFVAIAALISPSRAARNAVRERCRAGSFVEVFVNAPLLLCEQRDVKGLYARAREGGVQAFTGISAPYEPPLCPELEVHTDGVSVDETVGVIAKYLRVQCAECLAFCRAQ